MELVLGLYTLLNGLWFKDVLFVSWDSGKVSCDVSSGKVWVFIPPLYFF